VEFGFQSRSKIQGPPLGPRCISKLHKFVAVGSGISYKILLPYK
jgi:hypothetical protein